MANTPRSFVEGIEMLKRGGMMLEMGNFADTGEVGLNVHRHVCSKNKPTNAPVSEEREQADQGVGPRAQRLGDVLDRLLHVGQVRHRAGRVQHDGHATRRRR